MEDPHKRLWIGTMGTGLYYADLPGSSDSYQHIKVHQVLSEKTINQWINTLLYIPDGRLYVGTYDGIKCIDTQNLKVTGNEKALIGLSINTIAQGPDNHIWVGTPEGIYVMDYKLNIIEKLTTHNGLPNNLISSIITDKNKDLWVSTSQGIAKYNPHSKSFIPFLHQTDCIIMNSQEMPIAYLPTEKFCLEEPTVLSFLTRMTSKPKSFKAI